MLKDSPDYPFQRQTVDALRVDGAQIFEAEHDWFAEVRSTLKALRLRRTAEVKRRLAHMTPHAAVFLEDGRGGFVPLADMPAFVDASHGEVQFATVSRRSDAPLIFFPWHEVTMQLPVRSRVPAALAWMEWFCRKFLPAMRRHGWYDPATNHEPPPSRQLDAIELKEQGRDVMNALIPGLGDMFAESRERDVTDE